jgi:hypothetical protein
MPGRLKYQDCNLARQKFVTGITKPTYAAKILQNSGRVLTGIAISKLHDVNDLAARRPAT